MPSHFARSGYAWRCGDGARLTICMRRLRYSRSAGRTFVRRPPPILGLGSSSAVKVTFFSQPGSGPSRGTRPRLARPRAREPAISPNSRTRELRRRGPRCFAWTRLRRGGETSRRKSRASTFRTGSRSSAARYDPDFLVGELIRYIAVVDATAAGVEVHGHPSAPGTSDVCVRTSQLAPSMGVGAARTRLDHLQLAAIRHLGL